MSGAPKIIDAPDTIWLNYGDIERDCTHAECYREGDVTWCQEPVFDSDVKYVRADIGITSFADASTLARIAELERENAELRKDAERYQWLRRRRVFNQPADRDGPGYIELAFQVVNGKSIDAAIDAAIAREKENERG